MKKTIILLFLLAVSGGLMAQSYSDIKVSQLPKATQTYIAENMQGMEISRAVKIEDNGTVSYGVVFESRGRKHVLIFDKDGNFVQKGDKLSAPSSTGQPVQSSGTATAQPAVTPVQNASNNTKQIPAGNLPGNVQTYIKTNYPNGKIVSASQLTQNSILFYQVSVADGGKEYLMTFNSKGNYLSKRSYTKQEGKPSNTQPNPQPTPPKSNPSPAAEQADQPKK